MLHPREEELLQNGGLERQSRAETGRLRDGGGRQADPNCTPRGEGNLKEACLRPSIGVLLPSLAAVAAKAGDEEPVAIDVEVVLPGDGIAEALDLVAVELDQLVADLAMEVIVTGVAVLMFVDAASPEGHLADQAGFGQFAEGAVDRGPAHLAFGDQLLEMVHQLVGVEVVVMAEDLLDDDPALVGDPFAARLEELHEPIHGGLGRFDRAERVVTRHGKRRLGRGFVGVAVPGRLGRGVRVSAETGTLADLVEKPAHGYVQLLFGFVVAIGDLCLDLIDTILADLGQVADLVDELSGIGELELVLDRTCFAHRLPVRYPGRVRGTDGLGSVQMGRTVDLHLITPKRTPLEKELRRVLLSISHVAASLALVAADGGLRNHERTLVTHESSTVQQPRTTSNPCRARSNRIVP